MSGQSRRSIWSLPRLALRVTQKLTWAASFGGLYLASLCHRSLSSRILIVSDSRGLNLTGRSVLRYADRLSCRYRSTRRLYPKKWTTIADLYELLEGSETGAYDVIIAHVGISDFSPRGVESTHRIYREKQHGYDALFGGDAMRRHLATDLGTPYEGEPTNSMFSLEMLKERLIPWLASQSRLVYVVGNPILRDWQGDYWRPRPDNIEMANLYMTELAAALPRTFSCMNWTRAEILSHTTDSVHLNSLGHGIYARALDEICGKIIAGRGDADKHRS